METGDEEAYHYDDAADTQQAGPIHLTVGVDLGDRSSLYCVLDEAGDVLMEQRLSTTPKAIKEIFGAMPRSRIALETGTHSPWVSRLLSELGHEAIVAHARSVRLIGESRRKDDRIDARTLARLVRIDPQLLCPVKHRSAEAQADLTVIRARAALVRTRTMLVNAARGLTKSYGERLRGCSARGMKPKAAQDLSPELKSALEPMMREIESVSERICEYDHLLESMTRNRYPKAGAAEADQGSGNANRPHLYADAGRSTPFSQEPGCRLLRGSPTWEAQLGTE
ncbi:IS110 family transposase [Tunturiibacter gelidiferens]|uniref:IS110 family transposase n=1 Tax=Tunturiibacter gelidiferens TaxID=3069689 RepID=UPI003D9BD330